jgi:methyl-accepting chemotaxis protein
MKNITVRNSLLAVLVSFTAMIIVGAALGLFALRQANVAMESMHDLSEQVIVINDAYKDTTRTRSAMVRAYTTLKDGGSKADRDSALASARKSYQRTQDSLANFEKDPLVAGQDADLRRALVEAGRAQQQVMDRASSALAADDTDGYTQVNTKQ